MPDEDTTKVETTEQPAEPVKPVEQPVKSSEPPANEPEEFDKDRAMNTIKNLREIEKQAKKDAKELETLRAEKQQREEAEMTELEKANKQLADLQAKNAEMQANIWRNQAANEANLPPAFADRVKGATLEEMKADALKLAEALPKVKAPAIQPTNPSNGGHKENVAEMRERLFGRQGNVFDMDAIRQGGGGVVWEEGAENQQE